MIEEAEAGALWPKLRARQAAKLDQLQLQLEECEAAATEDEVAAILSSKDGDTAAAAGCANPSPIICRGSGGAAGTDLLPVLRIGEAVASSAEDVRPRRRWSSCRASGRWSRRCGRSSPAGPARRSRRTPRHSIRTPRGFVGPNLLATILFERSNSISRLNRQSERYAREGALDLSESRRLPTRWEPHPWASQPLHALIAAHVLAAERLHEDDTTVPILARGQDRHGPDLDLCARRQAPLGGDPPGSTVLRLEGIDDRSTSRWPPPGSGRASWRPMPTEATTGLCDPRRPGRAGDVCPVLEPCPARLL